MMSKRQALMALAGAAFHPGFAMAGPYPERPVKIVVSGLPGVPFDFIARTLADKLSIKLKQTFIVENRPGAAGNFGAEAVARAAPDGHTLLIALGTTFTVNPSVYKTLPYDPDRDLRPISILVTSSTTLVVHPSIRVNSVPEFVAFAKKEPITYAHGGNGTPGHLSMEYFRLKAGFSTNPVPYRGNAALVTDLLAGQIKFGFVSTAGTMPHVRAGRLKGLAISASVRSPLAPEMPTMAEAGYPDFKVELYYVMMAPAGIPEPIAALLEREVRLALNSPDLQDKFRASDHRTIASTGADARAQIKSDRELWAKVVKAANMRID